MTEDPEDPGYEIWSCVTMSKESVTSCDRIIEFIPHNSRLFRIVSSEREIGHKMLLTLLVAICSIFRGIAGQLCILMPF